MRTSKRSDVDTLVDKLLYTNGGGVVVEVLARDGGKVVFREEGGLLDLTVSEAAFDREFTRHRRGGDLALIAVVGEFTQGISLMAYSDGEMWSGWQCPFFEMSEALRLISLPGLHLSLNKKAGYFVESNDLFGDPVKYRGVCRRVGQENKILYPIGIRSWCWRLAGTR
jgi:hypothetical protein